MVPRWHIGPVVGWFVGLAAWKSLGWSLGIQLLYVLSELFMCSTNVQLLGNCLEVSRHMEAVESSWNLLEAPRRHLGGSWSPLRDSSTGRN